MRSPADCATGYTKVNQKSPFLNLRLAWGTWNNIMRLVENRQAQSLAAVNLRGCVVTRASSEMTCVELSHIIAKSNSQTTNKPRFAGNLDSPKNVQTVTEPVHMSFDEPFEHNSGDSWFWLLQHRRLLDKLFGIYVHNVGSPLKNVCYDPIIVYLTTFSPRHSIS
ncbi:uncharacterized protein BT62DRAFT_924782 [Guyanagaster necrorhizus]|uniref:HNH nuclease domain-containing protein n=1 Tax=Guyanagaster necrorhizus TaxID=856835 RepID=A0A9P8AL44_9AGAR|nr:uncharacterized protein BT62DRAFT_924782 [Guyanagaster necrorhizus MCA 3950]KAG7439339.1 hypothetical protein BT62DRAFT_924782 [Guyanagaster necrorhizus MCA 3950]